MRDRAKNDIVRCNIIFQKWTGPDMFSWVRYYVAEVCALLSALLFLICIDVEVRGGLQMEVAQKG